MVEFYEETHNFIAYLLPEERRQICHELSEILQLHSQDSHNVEDTADQKKRINLEKPYAHYKQLFQCKNARNEEIIIRKVSKINFFQQTSQLEVFFNFKEKPLPFIYQLIELLQREVPV